NYAIKRKCKDIGFDSRRMGHAFPLLASLPLVVMARSRSPDGLIVVSRHGVRRQFPSNVHEFDKYAPGKEFQTSDEDWGVDGSMGVLTQHGYDATYRMGVYQGQKYGQNKFSLSSCDEMFVYCEEDMPRDEFTSKAFFSGFTKGWGDVRAEKTVSECPVPELYREGVEYLIDQGSKPRGGGKCRLGSKEEVMGVVGEVDEWTRLLRPQLEKLNEVLGCCDRSLCGPEHPEDQPCNLWDMPHVWDEDHWYVTFTGPVYAGKYFSEWFLLNYLNGMDYAWGNLTEEDVTELSAFVTEYRHFEFDLLAARPFGSALLTHILGSLEQMETDESVSGIAHDPKTKLVYYAAHDTNLLYLAELLDLKWVSKGWQPNHTPPGGELIFEAYDIKGEWFVAAFFDIAMPSQIRSLSELSLANPPDRVAITIPGCSEGEDLLCPLHKLKALVIRAIDKDCITPPELSSYVDSLWAKDPVAVAA
ncbi:unnamed protein product, partial [Discosporangium mesarthrocarpum]